MNSSITIEPGATPNFNELSIASFLVEAGFTKKVHFLKASMIKGVRTPDAEINGLKWEMKTPIGSSSQTIKRAVKNASGQSNNLIFDLRHSALPDQANIPRLEKEFNDIKKLQRLVVITKTKEILDFCK